MAAATNQQPAPQPSNWLAEWNQRTPFITKAAIFSVLPVTTICLLVPSVNAALSLTPAAFTKGHVWRLVTSLVDQGQFFALLFVVLMLAMQAPATERAMGSLRFLISMVWLGLVINVIYAAVAALLYSLANSFSTTWFGPAISQGLWPVFMAVLSINALADPQGSSQFCCMNIPNRLFPWFLLLLFSLLAFSLQLDLTIGVLLGHAFAYLRFVRYWLSPSHARLTRWEAGWATRIGLARMSGYVPLPTTGALQAGDHNTSAGGGGWENPFSSFAMFGATSRQRQEQQQRAQQQQQGDVESGSGGGFHVFRGLRPVSGASATAPSSAAAGGGNTAGTNSSWGSGGQVLGSSTGTGSSSSSSSSDARGAAPAHSAAAVVADEARIAAVRAATLARMQQQKQQQQRSTRGGTGTPTESSGSAAAASTNEANGGSSSGADAEHDLLGLDEGIVTASAPPRSALATFSGAGDDEPGESASLLGSASSSNGAGARAGGSASAASKAPSAQGGTTAVRSAPAPSTAAAANSSAPATSSVGYAAGIRDLVALGFGAQEAAAALARTGGDVDAAAALLFEAEDEA